MNHDIKDLASKSASELQVLLQETMDSLFKLKMQNFSNQLRDTSQLRKLRSVIARIKTLLSEKQKSY